MRADERTHFVRAPNSALVRKRQLSALVAQNTIVKLLIYIASLYTSLYSESTKHLHR